jgi:hypothetical protein
MHGNRVFSREPQYSPRKEMLGGMLNRKILPAFQIQNEFRGSGDKAATVFRTDKVENLPVFFQYVQEGYSVDASPIGGLAASFRIKDCFIQDKRRFIPFISQFKNICGIGIGGGVFIIGGGGFHYISIGTTGFQIKELLLKITPA